MIYLIIILSFYLRGRSKSYFQKFPEYEYGFITNATYHLQISNWYHGDCVFGFATKKELESINKIRNIQDYCHGEHQISEIQTFLNKSARKTINGKIKSKTVLTPYIFTCNHEYYLEIFDVKYKNGGNQLDYRCQNSLKMSIIYQEISLIRFIVMLFVVNSFSDCVSYAFFFFVFIYSNIQSQNFFLELTDKEYFDDGIFTTMKSFIKSYKIYFFIFLWYVSILHIEFRTKKRKFKAFMLYLYVYDVIFVVILDTVLIFFVHKTSVAIALAVLFAIFILNQAVLLFFYHFSFASIGCFILFISSFVALPIASSLIKTQNVTSTANCISIINIISGACMSVSGFLILIQLRIDLVKVEKNEIDTNPLLSQENNNNSEGNNRNDYVECSTLNPVDTNEEKK